MKNTTLFIGTCIALQLCITATASAQSARTYTIPGVSNQQETDRFGLWAFQVGLNAGAGKVTNHDALSSTGKIKKEKKTLRLHPQIALFRLGRIYRHSTILDYQYDGVKHSSTFDATETNENIQNFNLYHSSMFRIGQHFAAGSGFMIDQNSFSISPAIEANLFPYQDFFKRYWLTGIYYKANLDDGILRFTDSNFDPLGIYTEAAVLTKWGFWQAGAGYSRTFFASNNRNQRDINGNLSAHYNLGRSWYANCSIEGNSSRSDFSSDTFHFTFSSFSCTWGLNYYFGNGRENVINPRMTRR